MRDWEEELLELCETILDGVKHLSCRTDYENWEWGCCEWAEVEEKLEKLLDRARKERELLDAYKTYVIVEDGNIVDVGRSEKFAKMYLEIMGRFSPEKDVRVEVWALKKK